MNATDGKVFEKGETISSWDDDYYHPIALRYYDKAVPAMLRLLGARPGDVVLDAGCGPGVHSIRAARAGLRVKAVDFSDAMLAEARRRVAAAGVADAVDFAREDLTRLTFPDASFRYVFSWGVVIHIRELEAALDELARVVRPGGRLALYVTNDSAVDHWVEAVARFVLRKPQAGVERLPLGRGNWYEYHGERLWVWRVDTAAVTRHLAGRGMRRVARTTGVLTEIQRRVPGPLRTALLRLNNGYHRLGLPAALSATNLLVFEKADTKS